ncbi:hypothetical protein BCR39DRAFT_562009 [Naematelia encephala]|uniref:Uncharacterized protein n=1 Tax=Naematelia encephala TaxID=71784 RepID=A0A1Y2AL46_9TREE|nr:hypothetical protein BCR39DRAFT_562009 [Naematelia encephala]
MSTSRPIRPRYSALPPQPSHSTITFLASWRGQLLICTVVLVLGFVYFIVRAPIATAHWRRREALSAMRTAELVSEESKKEDDRGRERKRDIKRRKGSLLRVPNGNNSGAESSTSALAGPSSLESSPNPMKLVNLNPKLAIKIRDESSSSPVKASKRQSHNGEPQPSTQITKSPPPPIHIPGPSHVVVEISPWNIPLPESPVAGPSRLVSDSEASIEDSEMPNTDESTILEKPKPWSNRFSIIPEDGYLPAPQPAPSSNKKKRRKGKPAAAKAQKLDGAAEQVPPPRTTVTPPQAPSTPSRAHSRKASLGGRPANMDLSELLDEHDRTIDVLRAEIGQAKAQEGKAKEDALRAVAAEERARSELDRARKIGSKNESESRRRESELQTRLQHLGGLQSAMLQRLAALEGILRDTGHQALLHGGLSPMMAHSPVPPPSPFGMNGYPAASPRNLTPNGGFVPYPSPGMYPSPMLHPGFAHSPSPFRRQSMSMSMPGSGPGAEEISSLAGPLTPGQHVAQFDIGSGTLPLRPNTRAASPIGLGLPSSNTSGQQQPTADELRRISIQESVMKVKTKVKPIPDQDHVTDDTIRVINNGNGNGNGDGAGDNNDDGAGIGIETRTGTGTSSATSSLPTSPSPSGRRQMLLTPANADLYNGHGHTNGTGTIFNGNNTVYNDHEHTDGPGAIYNDHGHTNETDTTVSVLRGIRVINDEDGGKTYYRDDGVSSIGSGSRDGDGDGDGDGELAEIKERGRARVVVERLLENENEFKGEIGQDMEIGRQNMESDVIVHRQDMERDKEVRGDENENETRGVKEEEEEEEEGTDDGEIEVPMFASLAHTPEQVAEMRRLRDRQIRARARARSADVP